MKTAIICATYIAMANALQAAAVETPLAAAGMASWYGEDHRGRLMANGRAFNPDKLTAASWFYPLGTRLRVTAKTGRGASREVMVTVTDRGPAKDLVNDGRIIDLTHAAFKRLADPSLGLVDVRVAPIARKARSPEQANDGRVSKRKAAGTSSTAGRVS